MLDKKLAGDLLKMHAPALMLSMDTVFGRSALGAGISFGGYNVVLKRVFTNVDLPSPDSPACVAHKMLLDPGSERPRRHFEKTREDAYQQPSQ